MSVIKHFQWCQNQYTTLSLHANWNGLLCNLDIRRLSNSDSNNSWLFYFLDDPDTFGHLKD